MEHLFERLRLPIGSLVVDLSLVLFVTYTAGQLVERLEAIDKRVTSMESREVTPGADRRLSVLEAEIVQHDRELQQVREETLRRLESIEAKIDQHANNKH